MLFVLGFIVGLAAAYTVPLLKDLCMTGKRPPTAPKTAETATPDERRRTERALREYRNFMTYDGYAQQDDPT